jgi:predicted amidohydrolase YtcJ
MAAMQRPANVLRAFLLFSSCFIPLPAAGQSAATMFRAVKIYTMEADSVHANRPAVAVKDGRIVAVGDSAVVAARLAQLGLRYTVDRRFASNVIVPGFVEAHTHFQLYGTFAATPYVGYGDRPAPDGTLQRGVKTLEGVIHVLRTELAKKPGVPVFAYGTDPIYWNGTRLTGRELNLASRTVPIMVQMASGHIVVCNDTMLKLVETENPAAWQRLVASGAVVQIDGQPTGELDEVAAVELAFSVFTKVNPGFALYVVGALERSADMMRRAGITTATDMFFAEGTPEQERLSRALYGTAALAPTFPRVYLAYSATALVQNYGDSAAAHLKAQAARDTGKIRVGPVKIVLDGSVQGYTAVLTDYVNPPRPGANRIWNVQPGDSLFALAQPFWNDSIRLAVHVNGDSATGELIRTVRRLQAARPWPDHRTSFEHNPAALPDQYDAIAALGATVNLFAGHIWYYGPEHERYTLGPARTADIAAADWALARHIPFSLHSDAPVTPAGPLFSMWNAVNRVMPTTPDSVLGPQHRITVGQALRAMTMGSAYLLGAETEIGSIKAGKYADFTVLGQDPFAVAPMRLCAVPVVGTVTGGNVWQPSTPTTPFCPAVPSPAAQHRH